MIYFGRKIEMVGSYLLQFLERYRKVVGVLLRMAYRRYIYTNKYSLPVGYEYTIQYYISHSYVYVVASLPSPSQKRRI